MKPVSPIIPGDSHEPYNLSGDNPKYAPLPAIQISKGVWLARWEFSDEEISAVNETKSIYVRMHALDGDELVMAHHIFVEKPTITEVIEKTPTANQSTAAKSTGISKDAKDEIRYLIHQEINKAFNAALSAATNYPIDIGDVGSQEKSQARKQQNEIVAKLGKAVGRELKRLSAEAHATIVEKTDPGQANVIRRTWDTEF